MNKTVYFAAAVAGALLLAGCSAVAGDDPQGIQPFAAQDESSEPTDSPDPLDCSDNEVPGPGEQMTFMQSICFIPSFASITEDEATAMATEVCAQLDAGVDPLTIDVGVPDVLSDTRDAVWVSSSFFCDEYADALNALFTEERVANLQG